jgi:hypothetical protein
MSAIIELPRIPSRLHAFLIALGLVIVITTAGSWWGEAMRLDARVEALGRANVTWWHRWQQFERERISRGWDGLEVRRWERSQLDELGYRAELDRLEAQDLVKDVERLVWMALPGGAAVLAGVLLVLYGRRLWAERDRLEKDLLRARLAGGAA